MTDCTPIPKSQKRRKAKPDDRLHKQATQICAESECLLCDVIGCVPAHYPRHRGMAGGHAGWSIGEWIALCPYHHDLVDGRLGVSDTIEIRRAEAKAELVRLTPAFWQRIREEYVK